MKNKLLQRNEPWLRRVEINLELKFAADNNQLGWYSLSDKGDIHWLTHDGNATGIFDFDPRGDFGLIGTNGLGQDFFCGRRAPPLAFATGVGPNPPVAADSGLKKA